MSGYGTLAMRVFVQSWNENSTRAWSHQKWFHACWPKIKKCFENDCVKSGLRRRKVKEFCLGSINDDESWIYEHDLGEKKMFQVLCDYRRTNQAWKTWEKQIENQRNSDFVFWLLRNFAARVRPSKTDCDWRLLHFHPTRYSWNRVTDFRIHPWNKNFFNTKAKFEGIKAGIFDLIAYS